MTEIRAGDTLIVFTSDWVTPEVAKAMQDAIKTALPGVMQVIVTSGVAGVAVYRDGEQ
jgi:hypothetical protein